MPAYKILVADQVFLTPEEFVIMGISIPVKDLYRDVLRYAIPYVQDMRQVMRFAIQCQHLRLFKWALNKLKQVHLTDALFDCCTYEYKKGAELLLDVFDIEEVKYDTSYLDEAVGEEHFEIANYLMGKGFRVNEWTIRNFKSAGLDTHQRKLLFKRLLDAY